MSVLNYKAYPTSAKFHKDNSFVKGIMGPFGCLRGDTKIQTIEGAKAISDIDKPTYVLSYDCQRDQFVMALTGGSYLKGKDYLYRVVTNSGEFVSSGHHRVLCGDGEYRQVQSLAQGQSVYQYSGDQPVKRVSSSQVELSVDVLHYQGKHASYLGDCAALNRQYGQQLLEVLGSGPVHLPLSGDAQKYGHDACRVLDDYKDGLKELEQSHTHPNQYGARHSTDGSSHLPLPPSIFEEGYGASISSLPQMDLGRPSQQSVCKCEPHRNKGELNQHCPYNCTSISKDTILEIEKLDVIEEYWDLMVLDTNNYVTVDGTIHHNSGKSVSCCFEIFMRAQQQTPGKDGMRRSRWVIARNTQPELETTTIATWLEWFPEHEFGKMRRKPPFTHKIKFNDVELEVVFLALDRPEDIKKLLGAEATGIWFNEAREINYEMLEGATGRVGRFPPIKDKPDDVPKEEWPKWSGIIMDTNPPSDEHWWCKSAEEDAWAYDEDGRLHDNFRRRGYETVDEIPETMRWSFYQQPSGLDPMAENIEHLPGGYDYYNRQIPGKTKEWINVYVHGNYGTIVKGLPVYAGAYNPDIHRAKFDLERRPSGTVYMGIDASGRHPATVFIQRMGDGQLQVVHEFCVSGEEGMGAENYARLLKQEMNTYFAGCDFEIWGDPAGGWGQNTDERTYFDILKAAGIFCKPSPGLRFAERKEAVLSTLSRMISGKPAILVSKSCKTLLRGFEGAYKYKKLNVSGETRYDEKPDKSDRSADVHDALQYVLCGMGELKKLYGRNRKANGKTVVAKSGYSIGSRNSR